MNIRTIERLLINDAFVARTKEKKEKMIRRCELFAPEVLFTNTTSVPKYNHGLIGVGPLIIPLSLPTSLFDWVTILSPSTTKVAWRYHRQASQLD
jgi:hypothetical protein